MKKWQYITSLLLGALCVTASVVLIIISRQNSAFQAQLQARQAQLNSGIMSQQGQQIANNILQDMGNSATKNKAMAVLLAKHGFKLPEATPAAPEKSTKPAPATTGEEK